MTTKKPRSRHEEVGAGRARCGETRGVVITTDKPEQVTCKRCLHLAKEADEEQAEKSVPATVSEDRAQQLEDTQQQQIDWERGLTLHEVLAFCFEGDLEAAIFRMQRGFDRQVRLAGLEREIREHREKELQV